MKGKATAVVAGLLAATTVFSFSGCAKSNQSSSFESGMLSGLNAEIPDYIYDEEKGAVIDTNTGEIVTDATYNKETKEIVKNGKVIQKNTESVVSSTEAEKIVNKKAQETKKQPTNNSNPSTTPSNPPAQSNTKNDEYQFSGQPSSSKKVSFNKDRLLNKMYSVYEDQKPVLNHREKMSKEDYIYHFEGTCPQECKDMYDWYMDCLKNKKDGEMNIPLDRMSESSLFSRVMQEQTYTGAFCKISRNPNDNFVKIVFDYDYVMGELDRCYNEYCAPIDQYNARQKADYEETMTWFNQDIVGYIPETANTVVDAVNKAGIQQGENEVSAINKIVDYISKKSEYDYDFKKNQVGIGRWINDCINKGLALCDGYAKSFYAMCYYCGINVDYYGGKTNDGESHAWNSVTINGVKYMFDVTWFDIQRNSSIQDGKHIWVAQNDKTFNSTHIGSAETPTYW